MRKSRFTEGRSLGLLQEYAAEGEGLGIVGRKPHGMSDATAA